MRAGQRRGHLAVHLINLDHFKEIKASRQQVLR
jgi:hypothetical protein